MALNMIDRHQRDAAGVAEPLHAVHAGQQRAYQPGAVGHGQRIHVGKRHVRLFQRLIHHPVARIHVSAAGDLRHHAAIQGVGIRLRKNHAGNDLPPVFDDGGGSLVAAGFHGQNAHGRLLPQRVQLGLHFRDGIHGNSSFVSALERFRGNRLYPARRRGGRPSTASAVSPKAVRTGGRYSANRLPGNSSITGS